MQPRFLVVGAGGIGGIVAAQLTEHGHDVTALTKNEAIAAAIREQGFQVRENGSTSVVRGKAVSGLSELEGQFDFILLATQPPQVEEAARVCAPLLASRGSLVCFQNGLCEERVAPIVGSERVIGAVVAWGASMLAPGVYDKTSSGGFQVGRLDGVETPSLQQLARALECVGETVLSKNLAGARWSKLAINNAISSLGTVGGDRLGVLMRKRHVRRLALEIMTETVRVAEALKIKLEKVSGTLDLEWIALTPQEESRSVGSASLFAKHALLLAVGARYRRLRSSMLSAIERGRVPAVEFLNGEVVRRSEQLGLQAPVNRAIRDMVLNIAAGNEKSSREALIRLYQQTRQAARS